MNEYRYIIQCSVVNAEMRHGAANSIIGAVR